MRGTFYSIFSAKSQHPNLNCGREFPFQEVYLCRLAYQDQLRPPFGFSYHLCLNFPPLFSLYLPAPSAVLASFIQSINIRHSSAGEDVGNLLLLSFSIVDLYLLLQRLSTAVGTSQKHFSRTFVPSLVSLRESSEPPHLQFSYDLQQLVFPPGYLVSAMRLSTG